MPQPNLTAEELLAWVETTTKNWRKFLAANPGVLTLPCDIYKPEHTVAGLVRHIVAVDLRYAQRLAGIPETPYEDIPTGSIDELYAVHDHAIGLLRPLLADPGYDWDRDLEFDTITLGRLAASRRVILFHMLLHSPRHYGQLATLVRQQGFKTNFAMDYLVMGARRV